MTDPRLLKHAKALRKNMTDAEQKLWYHLRGHRLQGVKFKRQRPVVPQQPRTGLRQAPGACPWTEIVRRIGRGKKYQVISST